MKEEEIANILRFVQKDRSVLGETWTRVIKVDKNRSFDTDQESQEEATSPEEMKNNNLV